MIRTSLLVALAVALPAVAHAQVPADYYSGNDKAYQSALQTIDGIAKISGPPEAPYVEVIGDREVVITGPLVRDLVGQSDTHVRIRGYAVAPPTKDGPVYIYGESFAPLDAFPEGSSDVPVDFVQGVVEFEPIPPNVRLPVPPIRLRSHSGKLYKITDDATRFLLGGADPTIRYSGAIGASVTLFGTLGENIDPGVQAFETRSNQMLIKGRIQPLYHILGFDSPEAMKAATPDARAAALTAASERGAAPAIAPFPDGEFPSFALLVPRGDWLPLYTNEPNTNPKLGRGEVRWVTLTVDRPATADGITKLRVKRFSREVEPPAVDGLRPLNPGSETVPDADPFGAFPGVGTIRGSNGGRYEVPTVESLQTEGGQTAPDRH